MVRPRKDPSKALSAIVYVRLTESQRAALQTEADQRQLRVSDIARAAIQDHIQARYAPRRDGVVA